MRPNSCEFSSLARMASQPVEKLRSGRAEARRRLKPAPQDQQPGRGETFPSLTLGAMINFASNMRLHLVVACLVFSTTLSAQTSAGLVVVNVQDPSGAAVSGATVTITDETTSVVTR